MKKIAFTIMLLSACSVSHAKVRDSLSFVGQLSMWALYNFDNKELPASVGGRYIPQLDYQLLFAKDRILDFELSGNFYGSVGFRPFDTCHLDGNIKPYRAWARFSTKQYEVRGGLQKINFGSAVMFRPLMWFDQIDPRDPLQLTDGVWGGLFRYYFLNNANIWVWALYGSKKLKGWEVIPNNPKYPEVGVRAQYPVKRGEIALSYDYRVANTENLSPAIPACEKVGDHRIGLDGKWDVTVGLWFEAAYVHKERNLDMLTNQEMLTVGTDYTFGVGNGLHLTFEQLVFSYDKKAFSFDNVQTFSGLSLSYPVGMLDNLSTIVYFDWINKKVYSFLSWQRTYDKWAFYLMAYWNPREYAMPMQTSDMNLYAGKGIQFMVVFNHGDKAIRDKIKERKMRKATEVNGKK